MSTWYYAQNGQQVGPVTLDRLRELIQHGVLDPKRDLVWTESMSQWTVASQVPGLQSSSAAAGAATLEMPEMPPDLPVGAGTAGGGRAVEIAPGSSPLEIFACLKRGYVLTTRNFGIVILIGVVYLGVMMASGVVLTMMDYVMGWHGPSIPYDSPGAFRSESPLHILIAQVLSIFLQLGMLRVGLNLVSGKAVAVGQLFGEGRKLLRALGGTILFLVVVMVGCLLLIVPGIYLALRYGQYLTAIVDRDMGILEAFRYSSLLTTGNRLNLFGLGLLSVVVIVIGILPLLLGLLIAVPMVWLASVVAYRWMQFGEVAIEDIPATTVPELARIC